MEVAFYHCTRAAPLAVLPVLAEKAVGAGYNVLVHCEDISRREEADEALWTYRADSFLPHGLAGGDRDAEQPALISGDFAAPNGARLAMCIGGALPGSDHGFERVLYLFDGGDEEAVGLARRHWRAVSSAEGTKAVYWRQGERGWEKQN